MASIDIDIKGVDKLLRKLNNISSTDKVIETMNNAVLLVEGQAKALVPVNTDNLRGSIHPKVIHAGNIVIGKVFTNVNYAPYVEFGTGIKGKGTYPSKDVDLEYRDTPWVYTPDGGDTYYRTEGQVAQPYMYPALKQNEKKIKSMFKEIISKSIKS